MQYSHVNPLYRFFNTVLLKLGDSVYGSLYETYNFSCGFVSQSHRSLRKVRGK